MTAASQTTFLPDRARQERKALSRMFATTLLGLSAATMIIGSPAIAQDAPMPRATIDAGTVEGFRTASGVNAFLGIPYAAPPVRDLRWRDPQPVTPWSGTFHADRYGPQCIQPLRNTQANQYSGAEITSEDCLSLNVWAPPDARKRPVVVFIHGGAFFIGSASMPLYAGDSVARHGAVFVNLNYRLGVLGFLAHPALSRESPNATSGNYGFLDQIAALQWVKRNIAQFGGDPDNVTIAGQSAGSMSILTLQSSPLAKGLFQRAIGMSGAAIEDTGPFALRPLAAAEVEGGKFQALVGAADLKALRNLPADRLTLPRRPGASAIGAIQDGYVLPTSIAQSFARGRQGDVPLLLGFARDEALGGFGPVKDLADYRAKAQQRFGDRTARFLELYPAATDAEARAQARIADRNATMVAAMRQWATTATRRDRSPVYTYMFAHPHSYAPGVTFSDLDPATAGAYHTSEVPFWLGTLDSFNLFRNTRAWTAADRQLSDDMIKALVSFASSGKPALPGLNWPRFEPAAAKLVILDTPPRIGSWPDEAHLDIFRTIAPAATPTASSGVRD